ncbi:MAG: mechanosensitive ion channel, partial [Nitrospinaceae bacterium]|nr:mechanosensitive ion channel [Nitrospinaceae bacterium]NIR53336.1 mechanosensitive ion channel [Nitrospinaceae bacterium]NIT80535.1 mechanosensitive ion channel [Nitrospinaceae bacterium]NIX32943.1 mechanosensitive ion channel [Nitrospinaceae bacterium]NIY13547.1 mechanosensitive ion channel [Nitrospinaceae bacterium]
MDQLKGLLRKLPEISEDWLDRLSAYLPNLMGAIILMLLGWGVAGFLRSLSVRLTVILNRILSRLFSKGRLSSFHLSDPLITLFSKIIFWGTILFFAILSTQILGLTAFSVWLNRLVAYFPSLVAGGLIILAGVLLSSLGRDLAISAAASANISQSKILGGIVQGVILFTAVIIGLDQIGIEVSFLITLLGIMVGAILGSLALALGLGTQDLASNLIGGHHVQKFYKPGQKVRLGDIEGVILELTPVAIILSTHE